MTFRWPKMDDTGLSEAERINIMELDIMELAWQLNHGHVQESELFRILTERGHPNPSKSAALVIAEDAAILLDEHRKEATR